MRAVVTDKGLVGLISGLDYLRGDNMFLGLGVILLLLWLGGFFVFHVTAFFIHILLILAVVSIIFHFMRGAASAA